MSDDKIWIIRDSVDALTDVNEQLSDLTRMKKICDLLDRVIKELNDMSDAYDDEQAEDNWS